MSSNISLMHQFNLPEGFSESPLPGVRFFASQQAIPRGPLIYDPGICIVVQGRKIGYLGDRVIQHDADNFLLVSVTVPIECETFASPEDPLLGLYVDIDMPLLHELISELGDDGNSNPKNEKILPHAIEPARLEPEMADATKRLLKCLQSTADCRILGPGLVREVLYRALQGGQAPALYALASHNGHFARVARSLKLIQSDYASNLDVERLARHAHMSTSAFHRAFKEVTSDSPLQYLKKIKLSKARDFMLHRGLNVAEAADKVGYESPTQFSREFKRYFGQSPSAIRKEVRTLNRP